MSTQPLPRRQQWPVTALACATGLAAAGGIVWKPLLAIAVAACAGLFVIYAALCSPAMLFAGCLSFALTGYAFLGRGFAYLGVAPLYIGELVLAVGLLGALLSRKVLGVLRSPLAWLLLVFGLQQAACTLPYLTTYGFDTLRDAVLWGYALFALLVAAFTFRLGHLAGIARLYWQLLPWFLFWAPFGSLFRVLGWGENGPFVPGTAIAILDIKPGDTMVHLTGAFAFLYLNLHRPPVRWEWLLWLCWFAGVLLSGSTGRGGLLSLLAALVLLVLLWPGGNWKKMAVVAVLTSLVLTSVSFQLQTTYEGRALSPQQLVTNVESLVSNTDAGSQQATRRWRVEWWERIASYTVFGEYFWTGKGYGVNLADADGFQVTADHSLRAPHNVHMTVLARSGVPGLFLWGLLQVGLALGLLIAYLRARWRGWWLWARLDLWLLAYWLAFIVNGSFDVFLEGPQGGIWFWSVFGLGLAAIELQRPGQQIFLR